MCEFAHKNCLIALISSIRPDLSPKILTTLSLSATGPQPDPISTSGSPGQSRQRA